MNSSLTLKVEPRLGSDISTVVKEAIHLAIKLNINIEFNFNAKTIIVNPESDIQKEIIKYHK